MAMKRFTKMIALACIGVLTACALCACAGQQQTAEQRAQAENRAYMSSVNKVAAELATEMEDLTTAISRGDTVTVVSKAKDALSVLDKLDGLEVPEALSEIHGHYQAAAGSLRSALEGYVSLYANGSSTSSSSYTAQLAQIQEQYNAGIAELKLADETAASMQ